MIEEVSLVDVCDIIAGQSPPSSTYNQEGNGVPFFQGKADFGETYPTVRYWCNSPKKISKPDDILFSVRAPVGPTNINNITACIGRGLAAIRCNNIERKYLLHYLRGNEEKIASLGSGSTFKAITIGTLKELKIPFPPLDQQKKIAAVLDAADGYRQKTKALISKYDELTQSLFLDMFGDPVTNPNGWEKVLFSDIATFHNGDRGKNYPSQSAFIEEGIPFINAGNLSNYSISATGLNFISRERYDLLNAGKIIIGDILFCLRGSLGKFAINSTVDIGAIASSLVLIRVNQQAALEYITGLLKSNYIKGLIEKFDNGSSQPNLSAKSVKEFLIPTPPIELQNQFAERAQAIESQKAQAQASLTQAEDLFNSLLQRAFKGELV